MDYERLTRAYREAQIVRILKNLTRIVDGAPAAAGRVVPEGEDLAIGEGRRLNMAVLFLDLSGFSGRPAETAHEQTILLRLFNLFFTEMIRIVEEYGGTVEKNTGDGLMAYFEDNGGDPPERGCKRAVASALTMMYTTQNFINPIIRESGLEELHFRVGIDHGPVTVAQVGAAQRFHGLVAIGTTANIACKMLDVDKPDSIIIGEAVKNQLPAGWLQWCRLEKVLTGWNYRLSGNPYAFYEYIGRWIDPA